MQGTRNARIGRRAASLLVAAATASAAASVWGSTAFTLVALPDTQNYVNNASNAPLFTQQTQWIRDEIQTAGNPRNIQFVSHLGDIVSEGNSLTQWDRASASMGVIDDVVPYGILPGNHDFNTTSNKASGTGNYVSYFGPTRFAGKSWYGGADPSGLNSYQRFSAGGFDFIHLSLEWLPTVNTPFRTPSPIQWAQSVIDANPTTPVILSTHENLDDDPPGRSGGGQAMWDQLVKRNDQIFMVLNGHYHSLTVASGNDGEYHQVGVNEAGRPVFEMLSDFQDYPRGGDGWLRLINFDIPNNKIKVETYSPVLNQFQTETTAQVGAYASQFEFDVDFASRLTPVIIPPPPPPPEPDFVFQEGLNGYSGTQDTMVRSNETGTGAGQSSAGDSRDRSFGSLDFISVDGDDGSPGLKPNQGLIRFDNVVGSGPGQIAPGTGIERATLVIAVIDPGSGFRVHEMRVNWDENSTWNSLIAGVSPDGIEASATVLATFGADNSSGNVGVGTLEIDVTSTIRGYLDGTITNLGWLLNPFTNGTNGVDFASSENANLLARPRLVVFVPEPAGLTLLLGAGLLVGRRVRGR